MRRLLVLAFAVFTTLYFRPIETFLESQGAFEQWDEGPKLLRLLALILSLLFGIAMIKEGFGPAHGLKNCTKFALRVMFGLSLLFAAAIIASRLF